MSFTVTEPAVSRHWGMHGPPQNAPQSTGGPFQPNMVLYF